MSERPAKRARHQGPAELPAGDRTAAAKAAISALAQAKADKHSGVRGMSEGKVAAKVFEMLDGGCNRSEIVQTLEITPHKVDALYEAWREPDLEASHQRQKQERQQERERQAWAEHDKRMRELDREFARQQEALLERLKR